MKKYFIQTIAAFMLIFLLLWLGYAAFMIHCYLGIVFYTICAVITIYAATNYTDDNNDKNLENTDYDKN